MKQNYNKALAFNLLMINTFVYVGFALYAPFLSAYFALRNMSSFQIGILLTIGPVLAIIIQPLWAYISDRTGRRKDILSIVALGSALSLFSFYIGNTFLAFFIASFLLAVFVNSIVPLSDAILIRNASKNGFDFAKIRMGGTIGYAIIVVIAGAIIRVNPSIKFLLGFIGFMTLLLFIRRLPKEENEEKAEVDRTIRHNFSIKNFRSFFQIFNTKLIYFVLGFAFISQIGLSFNWSFLGVYLLDLGYGQSTIGIMNSVSALSELPTLFMINRLIKKYGAMKIIIISSFIMSLRLFILAGGNIFFVFISQVLHGASFMSIYFSCAIFINENVKPGKQSQGQSVLAIIQMGIGSIIGNIFGGYLVDFFGLKSTYFYLAVMILLIILLILMLQKIFNKRIKSKAEPKYDIVA